MTRYPSAPTLVSEMPKSPKLPCALFFDDFGNFGTARGGPESPISLHFGDFGNFGTEGRVG